MRAQLIDAVSGAMDDDAMERYLEGEDLDEESLTSTLFAACLDGFCAGALWFGVQEQGCSAAP